MRVVRAFLLTGPLLLAACASKPNNFVAAPTRLAGPDNPAQKICADQGGQLEIRSEQAGEAGYCRLPDGSLIEEWKLYKGNSPI